MAKVGQKDTAPEMRVRRALWAAGHRYRLHVAALPGRPDIVFPKAKIAVFVHGCFWHRHDCRKANMRPASNSRYWAEKLERNVARDQKAVAELRGMGWTSITVWECESASVATSRVGEALDSGKR
jgi:DNA mismatch endonuclease (patch repair protein)